jgi:hypothetical protein
MNAARDDPQRLLQPEAQWTEPWGASEDGTHCDKCDGAGHVQHSCWSCLLTRPERSCPVCGGRVRWEDLCPVCRGRGRVDGDPRHGVSVFPTREALYRYMLENKGDLDGCTVVELEARPAEDRDFDADQGAMLVIPTAIRGCEPIDPELAERVSSGRPSSSSGSGQAGGRGAHSWRPP